MTEPEGHEPVEPDDEEARPERDGGFPGPDGLPRSYHTERMMLMPRDPEWLYVYWEIPRERVDAAIAELGATAETSKTVLRVHDVTGLIDSTSGRPRLAESKDYLTREVSLSSDHWYIKVERAERLYCVEYLVVAADGRAVSLVTSNLATTPTDRVSPITEETWVTGSPEGKHVARGTGPAETKWLEGQGNIHEALSSLGSAGRLQDAPPSEPSS